MVGLLQRRVKSVGIVGAGVSGVVTAAHLRAAGLEVTVFERAAVAGGVWVYDERPSYEPRYPSVIPSQGEASWDPEDVGRGKSNGVKPADIDEILRHAPPGPCYAGLMNNVSTRLLRLTLNSWKEGTEDYVKHHVLEEYIQDTSRKTGVEDLTVYNTRVERAWKQHGKWRLQTTTLEREDTELRKSMHEWEFDAFIVASGHYHHCRIPDIPGLVEWKRTWPSRVSHSKSYRDPERYRGQNVLLVGAGTSSTDIARELGPIAANIYQISRGGVFDLPTAFLPLNAERVAEIATFEKPQLTATNTGPVDVPIPSSILLKDGRRLQNIHHVILCTGYQFCHPFLLDSHEDSTPIDQASDTVLVTDGTQVHNLHKDIFYIPDPTLMFIGIPFYTATFTLFEFQACAVSAVLSGRAILPSELEMREEYRQRVRKKGHGRLFHSLRDSGAEIAYVASLVAWLNEDAARLGWEPVEGHTAAWHKANADRLAKLKARLDAAAREQGIALQQ